VLFLNRLISDIIRFENLVELAPSEVLRTPPKLLGLNLLAGRLNIEYAWNMDSVEGIQPNPQRSKRGRNNSFILKKPNFYSIDSDSHYHNPVFILTTTRFRYSFFQNFFN